ncbi:cell wall-binding repeat-containing protein [Peptoclostridium sp. AF21-18]|uniref:cell wall-binding repeat-containing protein n=1 Tax=Peptoclostridium sp. AF21-18 TaxID=2292243 RepID=UPI000E4A6DEE|nr:cell wall-binding repeat-containing protein [Peptoclostridium sp. AF21-18]RHQ97966.1 cell wall-binding repeat-containing protein [Peptoclostridium sp. AF21-18]
MNKNFRKWLACAVAVTIAVYNAPYSVEALEVIGDSVQMDSVDSSEGEQSGDTSKPEDDGVQSEDGTQAEEGNSENTTEQNNTDGLTHIGAFWVSGANGTDWTFSDNGELKISKDAINDIRIEGNGKQTTTDRVLIEAGYQGTVTIKNLNINSKDDYSRAFEVQTKGDSTTKVELILEGENTLKSGLQNPGLKFAGEGKGSLLTIKGNGQLTATGGLDGAGIGGGYDGSGSNIIISGGTVTATGGLDGAGIGGGYRGRGNNITITGGTVTAIGRRSGAGIGGGYLGSGNNITITGGIVTATGESGGAGIGGGDRGIASGTIPTDAGNGSNITITGGTVTAIGGSDGSGIGRGGGKSGSANNIKIAGGSVKASSISITPKDEDNAKDVYLVKLDGKKGITSIIVNDKDYKVLANHPDDDSLYLYMPVGEHTITTNNDTYNIQVSDSGYIFKNDWIVELSITGWTYGANPNTPTAESKFGNVEFKYSNEENDNYTSNVPTDAGTYYVKAEVVGTENYEGLVSDPFEFEIEQAKGLIKFKDGAKFDKIYDGKPVEITNEDVETSGSTGDVTFKFEKRVDGKFDQIQEVPTEAGTYRVKVSLAEDNNYTSAESKYLYFTIYKAPEITEENENVDTSTDRIEINTETENKGVYLYCTDSKDVPPLPETSTLSIESVEVGVKTWQEVTGSKIIFTGLESNTTYHVWKYDNTYPNKPEGEKLTYEYSIKTDTPSTPSIPSKPEEKPGIGVEVEVVDKIAGENRYDTSVSISQKVFPSKSEKVYLVSGEKFPDALSSAALTGKGDGPILLINDKNIDKILSEIDRLDAKEIVFIGGNSISDVNEAKIRKFAKENSSVVKSIVGKDRYETAVKVAEQTIKKYGNKGKVIIADGRNYPDAVSIASYAAKEGIPVILVNGNKVPDVVKNFLNKYKINSAIIVGGDKAVGKDVEKLFKSVDRVAGDDRYDTSKKIAEKFFAGSKIVFVASGESFADSLSVSYYAGAKNAPILLIKANSLDNDTKEYLEKNKDKEYIIVGGDKAINPDLFK